MKYIKKNINTKKSIKNYAVFFLIFIFFILGGLNERYNWKETIKNFFSDTYQTIISKIYYKSYKIEKIYLDIKIKEYKYLTSLRNDKILGKNSEEDEKWSDIKLSKGNDNKKYNAQIKLKGQLNDHFKHEKKWSFKIKIEDNFNVKGLTRFALQPPETLDYLNEWLFIKALEKKNLIALKTDYVELIVNGENFGIYTIQESVSKDTLEKNRRRDSAIIGFDNDNWLKEVNNYSNSALNSMEQSYFRSKIKPVRLPKSEEETVNLNLSKAIYLLDSFRNKSLKTSEAFDTNQLINALILKAIFSSVEFDWADMNFYFNPFTNLLEPILKEVHTLEKVETHQNNWWLDSFSISNKRSNKDYFLDQIYSDEKFYEKYLKKLNQTLLKGNYLDDLIRENSVEYNLYKTILKKHFPLKKIIGNQSPDVFEMQRNKMLDTLNPKIGINVYFLKKESKNLILNINNLQRLPVKILGLINEENNEEILFDDPYFIKGFNDANLPPLNNTIKIQCLTNETICEKNNLDKIKVIYQFLSQDKFNYEKIEKIFTNKKFNLNEKTNNTKDITFVELDSKNKIYKFKEGSWNISKNIVFQEEYSVLIPSGTELIFSNNARILSFSPINFDGTKERPIKLSGNMIGNKKFTGGISVINADKVSIMKNVIANNLSGLLINNEVIFSGAITFYKSDVEIIDSFFSNNTEGDDMLNIVSSKFKIENLNIENSLFDAIDFDYSNGYINKLKILNSGNDAVDFSVSNVEINNSQLINSGDKSISVGENSRIRGNSVFIDRSNIGIASKDSSSFIGNEIKIENSNIGLAAYIKKYNYNSPLIDIQNYKQENNKINFLPQSNNTISTNNNKHDKVKFDYSKL